MHRFAIAMTMVGVLATASVGQAQATVPAGKFGRALDARIGGVNTEVVDRSVGEAPLTVEAWVKLDSADAFNVIVAHEDKRSGEHWELYSYADTGALSVYLPGYEPAALESSVNVADGEWHHVAMSFDGERVRLYVGGEQVAEARVQRQDIPRIAGPIMVGYARDGDQRIGCDGVIAEVRISRGVRSFESRVGRMEVDDETLALWRFDQLNAQGRYGDASPRGLSIGVPAKQEQEEEDHFEGFREESVRDNRWDAMDSGPTFSASLATDHGQTMKAIAIRLGEQQQAAVAFDTETLRMTAAWEGEFIRTDPMRFGLIGMPRIAGEVLWAVHEGTGWAHEGRFEDPRSRGLGPIPDAWGRYEGLYMHGERVVLDYSVGEARVLDAPWLEVEQGLRVWTRTLEVEGARSAKRMAVCDVPGGRGHVRQIGGVELAVLEHEGQVTAAAVTGSGAKLAVKGERVVMEIPPGRPRQRVKLFTWSGDRDQLETLATLVRSSAPPEDLAAMTGGGPQRWPERIVTQGVVNHRAEPYVIDTLTIPHENPYNALMFIGGHDFLPDGDAVVGTVHGDVWIVSGIDETLDELTWKRFATGLFQPLGVNVVDGQIHVRGRDQITILHDLNGDGEADYYENFNNDGHVTANGHEYVTNLRTDAAGDFYFLKGDSAGQSDHDGSLLRVSADGEKLSVYATGIRNGNGLGIGPNDLITVSPQEGTWTPASNIAMVNDGGFYGYVPSHHREQRPEDYDRPMVWIPRSVDNSSGGQVWAPREGWGPLSGHMLHLSFGRGTMMLVLMQEVDGVWQGGVVPLPGRFLSGAHRGRFREQDGQLYVSGLDGWVTSAVRDGSFQRVRYTGAKAYLPVGLSVHRNGVRLTFSEPVDRELAEDVGSYAVERWNYRRSSDYGSAEWSIADPERQGRDAVEVRSARLSEDGRSVLLEIKDLKPVMQMHIRYNLDAVDGSLVRGSVYHTIHRLGGPAP